MEDSDLADDPWAMLGKYRAPLARLGARAKDAVNPLVRLLMDDREVPTSRPLDARPMRHRATYEDLRPLTGAAMTDYEKHAMQERRMPLEDKMAGLRDTSGAAVTDDELREYLRRNP